MLRSWLSLLLIGISSLSIASGPFEARGPVDQAFLDSLLGQAQFVDPSADGENTRLIGSGLAVLLGPFGAHRLYLGTTPKVAVVYGVTFGGFGVLALLDLGHLLFTKDLDPYRNNDRVFMWSARQKEPTPP